jgi:hypothetical protein
MENQQQFIADYNTLQQVDDAVKKLKKSGYDIRELEIIGQDCYIKQSVNGNFNIYDKMEKWGTTGLFTIGLCGLLFGLLFIFNFTASLPYFKTPIIFACIAVLLGATLPLIGMGFSKGEPIKYKTEIKAHKYVLFAQQKNANIEIIRSILNPHAPVENSIKEREGQALLKNEVSHFHEIKN